MAASTALPERAEPSAAFIVLHTEVGIGRPMAQVFDYVSNPSLWATWHPATVAVRDVPARPLTTGETVVEEIAAAGRRDQALWTVLACEPPELWVIATDTSKGAARITYRLAADGTGCRFHRTLEFRSKHWPWRALDATLMRWLLRRQSAQALGNLKRVLEG